MGVDGVKEPATDPVSDVTADIGEVQQPAGAGTSLSIPGRATREVRKTFRSDPSERPLRRRGFR